MIFIFLEAVVNGTFPEHNESFAPKIAIHQQLRGMDVEVH